MHTVTQFPNAIIEHPDMGIRMPDGCRLSARVWMPKDASENPVPAILEYIPYRKRDGTIARDELMHKYFAGRGYAAVRLDMRGSGESEGLLFDEYTEEELDDGVSAIAWLAEQPWCSGAVGMMGKSWGGFNCLQVGALAPPALKAILSVCSTVDRYADDIHYKGGCLLNNNFLWGAGQMLSYYSRPPDPALVGAAWRDRWLERLQHAPCLAVEWMRHQRRDAYWKHGSICENYDAIKAPVLVLGGWADNYMNTVSHVVRNLNVPAKGIVGPWVHQYPHTAGPAPQIGFLQEALRWWDHWLKGTDTGVDNDPAYRAYLQETVRPSRTHTYRPGHWLAESEWPSSRITLREMKLSAAALDTEGGEFNVSVDSPLDCGLGTGSYFPMSGAIPELSGDQRDDDARSACFDTQPLACALDIVGAPVVHIKLKVNKPHASLIVRLCEVHPDGASGRVTYGVLNLCHRESHCAPSPIPVNKAFVVKLDLDQIAYRIKAGMRLRLAVSNAYWPFLWPSPEKSCLTLLEGSLELPVHAASLSNADEWRFDEAEGASPWPHRNLRPESYSKTIETDLNTGQVTWQVHHDEGLNEDLEHGLISGCSTRECFRIHPQDPLSASAEVAWTQERSRGDWSIRTETVSHMWADGQTYYLRARVEAYESDELVFEKDYEESVPRDLG